MELVTACEDGTCKGKVDTMAGHFKGAVDVNHTGWLRWVELMGVASKIE